MAHFCVLVVTETPDGVADALRPFHDDDRDEGPAQPHFVFIEDRHSDINPSNGRRGYWRNPQGKWDGWTTGGRFAGLIGGADSAEAAYATAFFAGAPDRAREVFALLVDGEWIEPPGNVAAHLAALPATRIVTVIDCHS